MNKTLMKPRRDYRINIVKTKVIEGAGLPYTVYVSFDVDDYDSHNIKKCERDFRNLLIEHCGSDVGIYFDRYSMMATLNFRNEDEAAMFMMLI